MSVAGVSRRNACVAMVVLIGVGGCSRVPARIQPADIDPEGAGAAAVAVYDQDGDSQLSSGELKKCPALLASLASYDTSQDGKLDASEIAARLAQWKETRVGVTAATFYVELDGRRLAGAKIVLEPEPFLADSVAPASAEVNSSGLAAPSMAAELLPEGVRSGLQTGLYKIKITHPTLKIPAKYNEQTELGLEVPPHFDLYNPPTFKLTSK